jgi:hypothetical protein
MITGRRLTQTPYNWTLRVGCWTLAVFVSPLADSLRHDFF